MRKKKKKSSNWDQAPDAEAIQKMQQNAMNMTMKMMGMAGLTVTNAAAAVAAAASLMPGRAAGGLMSPLSMAELQKLKQSTLHARRVYCGNVQPSMSEQMIRSFLDAQVLAVPDRDAEGPPAPVAVITLNHAKMFAFVEFHCIEDADIVLCMDGITFQGTALKIRPPKDYARPEGAPPAKKYVIPGIISTQVGNDGSKIFLGNLPTNLTADDVKDFVTTFGPLKAFSLVKDIESGESKGYAFFSYLDGNVTEAACAGLNGIKLGDKEVVCQRGNTGVPNNAPALVATGHNVVNLDLLEQVAAVSKILNAIPMSRFLLLQNMATLSEMMAEREEILADVMEEVSKHGLVVDVQARGDKIFVAFTTDEDAERARSMLIGKNFCNRPCLPIFITEADFSAAMMTPIAPAVAPAAPTQMEAVVTDEAAPAPAATMDADTAAAYAAFAAEMSAGGL